MTNEEILELQNETIESLKTYLKSLIPSMEKVVIELKDEMQEDTWEYLRMILDGFNWAVEAFNATQDVINKDGIIDVKVVDESVKSLSDSYTKKDAAGVATTLEECILPFLITIDKAIS